MIASSSGDSKRSSPPSPPRCFSPRSRNTSPEVVDHVLVKWPFHPAEHALVGVTQKGKHILVLRIRRKITHVIAWNIEVTAPFFPANLARARCSLLWRGNPSLHALLMCEPQGSLASTRRDEVCRARGLGTVATILEVFFYVIVVPRTIPLERVNRTIIACRHWSSVRMESVRREAERRETHTPTKRRDAPK